MWDDDHIRSLLVSISLSYPLFQALKSREPVRTRDSRGNELLRHYYAPARHNLHTKARDDAITWAVVKTIGAFMNTHGGTLLVGVDDHGHPIGIESDFPYVKGQNRDGWELWLTTSVKYALGTRLPT